MNTLITGGVRSGKSRLALELAVRSGEPVLFVATAEGGDEEMKRRIEEHKRERPSAWSTLEVTTHVGSHVEQKIGRSRVVVVDCITLLVGNIFSQFSQQTDEQIDASFVEKEVTREVKELLGCINRVNASFIIVTNEVGLGLVPIGKIGRLYRDLLGKANQVLAERADEVYLVVAGLPVRIKPAPLPF